MAANAQTTLSIHGHYDVHNALVYIGGRNEPYKNLIQQCLNKAGFQTDHAPQHLSGMNGNNITNTSKTGAGVQLELSTKLRKSFSKVMTLPVRTGSITVIFLNGSLLPLKKRLLNINRLIDLLSRWGFRLDRSFRISRQNNLTKGWRYERRCFPLNWENGHHPDKFLHGSHPALFPCS